MLFALAPALYAVRAGLAEALKEGGRGGTDSRGRTRLRGVLVVSEVAFALLLAIGAGLMLQSFARLSAIRPGFDPSNLLTINIALGGPKYSKDATRTSFFASIWTGCSGCLECSRWDPRPPCH